MTAAVCAITIMLSVAQDDAAGIEKSKERVLNSLNLDPSRNAELIPALYFVPSSVDESVMASFAAGYGYGSRTYTNGYPGLVFAHREIAPEDLENPRVPSQHVHPVILIHDGSGWTTIIDLPSGGHHWDYAWRSTDGRRVYGIYSAYVGEPGSTLEIVMSTDGGWTWEHVASVQKPWYGSGFDRFTMDANGHGTLSIVLSDFDALTGTHMRAYFTTQTTDWGRTWSKYSVLWDTAREAGEVRSYDFWGNTKEPIREYLESTAESALESYDRFARHSESFARDEVPIRPPQTYLEKLEAALEEGLDADARRTILYYAIRNGAGNPDVVRLLLEHGASPDEVIHRSNMGREFTAIEFAERHGRETITKMLRNVAGEP